MRLALQRGLKIYKPRIEKVNILLNSALHKNSRLRAYYPRPIHTGSLFLHGTQSSLPFILGVFVLNVLVFELKRRFSHAWRAQTKGVFCCKNAE